MNIRNYLSVALIASSLQFASRLAFAQTPAQQSQTPAQAPATAGALRGAVTDPSGAAIAGATVIMTPMATLASPSTTKTDNVGAYEFKSLPTGQYSLTVTAPGFSVYENDNVVLSTQAMRLNVPMAIEVEQQKIQVSDTAPTVDVNPENNAGAITISGKELEALPDDPDELLTDLQALAGPSAGPNGGQLYIDGFTAGQLPPKESIREIRINQNPFSSEYDKLGYGRIEIFTKPGTDKFHGQVFASGNDKAFNSPNPFGGQDQPGYDITQFSGNIGGPLNKNASFYVDAQQRTINDLSAIDATTLTGPVTAPAESFVTEAVPNRRLRTNITPRIDYQISKNNTLTARYQYYRDSESADGVGQFNLSSQAYSSSSTEHTLQISDTQVIGTKIVNELRFQYLRDLSNQYAANLSPTLNVLGGFGGGGNSQGDIVDHQDHYELQNYTSWIHGNHTVKFGGRLRGIRDANTTTSGFNGTFTFSGLTTVPPCGVISCTPTPIPYVTYYAALQTGVIPPGPIATQLTFTAGIPSVVVTNYDVGLYYQDDWKVRSNITLSYGLRYETQNDIQDHADWAPRFGFAWGVGGKSSPPKVVLRGGFGIFYDRFQEAQILEARLLNGVTQKQFVVDDPVCTSLTDFSTCTGATSPVTPAIYQISPRVHAPYTLQSAISMERQLTKSATLNVTYLSSRGFDQLLTLNANAPYPGTPGSTVRPNPTEGNLYQYASEAVFKQNQLIANTNIRVGTRFQLFGYYVLNYVNSDTSGVSSFPSNSYDISQDYGRASFDLRNRAFMGGSWALPMDFRLSPFLVLWSGAPFNITTTNDLNNDSIFNDRPSFATLGSACGAQIYCTPLGNFNAAPGPSDKPIPINYGSGPGHATLNLRFTKSFGFGPHVGKGAGNQGHGPGPGGHGGGGHGGPLFGGGPMGPLSTSDRRYNFTIGASVRNIFNKVNLSNPSGILGSRFFDTSNGLTTGPFNNSPANRRIDLQATFSF